MAISRKRAACSSRPALRVPGRANVRRQPRAALVRWLRRLPTPPLRPALIGTTALTMAALCGSGAALAGPTGGVVTAGEAEIIYGDGTVTIEQQSDRVIIEWESYNVGAGESVHYNQPHELAELLNIVLGGHSQIDGTITANGRIFIANSAGITFGAEANVNVESIIAAALDVMDRDRFMAGDRLEFAVGETGDPTAVVENYGTITAHGMAALVGPAARNSGTIAADVTVIGGGEGVALDYYGDGLINFEITRPTTVRPIGSDGQPVEALVVNDGTILSDGGTVILTADAAAGVIDNVINLDGVVQARSVASRDGQVVLLGGEDGTVTVAGTIDATGDDAGEAGGAVHVLGDAVVLAEGADIDVSGQAGGGTALIGGDYLGGPLQPDGHIAYAAPEEGAGGPHITIDPVGAFETDGHIPTADIAYFAEGASITADATVDGDGGRVILWADEATQFSGAISVRGGAEGGDGGFVETSGGINLGVAASASVDALAPNGDVGDWLLDPRSVTIQTGGGATLLQIADAADTTNDLVVDPATLNAAMANVSIVASETITVTDAVSIAASGVGLTATAGTSITVNADITTNNGDITFVTDGLAINAAVNAGTGGVAIRRATAGNIGLGSVVWGQLDVSQLELSRITAATLTVGGSNTIQLDVADVDTTLTITGTVTLRALHDVWSATYLSNTNVFNALHTESNLAYVWGTQSLNDGPGSLPLAERTWTAVGGSLGSPSTVYIEGVIDTNGGAAHFAVGSGGDFWVVGPEDAVVTDGGTVTVVADVVTLNTATPATPAIDAGSGQVIFRRDTDGTMSVGDDNGGVHISQGELDVIAAGTLTVGAAASGDSHTTGVTVSTADLTGFGTVNLNALTAPGTITVAGPVSTAAGGGGLTATASGSITVDDTLTTNNGDVTFVTDSLAINAAVDAGTGGVAIRRATHGSGIVTVGAVGVGLSITQAEVDRITAASLSIGGSNTDAIYAEDLDATSISGPVSLNALYDGTTSTVQLIGSNTLNALNVEAGDGVWVWGTLTLNDGAGALPLADRTLTAVVRSETGPGSIDLYGVVDTNGGSATLAARDGGQFWVRNAESALVTDGGTVTVTADQVTLNPATPSSPAIDAGGGEIIFRRNSDGTISLGDNNGGVHISQGELDVIAAGTMTVGAAASGDSHTTGVTVSTADLTGFGTVNLNALTAPGTITVAGPVSTSAGASGLTATASGSITVNDTLTTNNGDVAFVTDSLAINAPVDAGTGDVAIRRVTVANIGLGGTCGLMCVTNAELARITAGTLSVGGSNTNGISLRNVDTTSTISGLVSLYALADASSDVGFDGSIVANALHVEANGNVWQYPGHSITLNGGAGSLPIADRTLTLISRNGDYDNWAAIDTNGGEAIITVLNGQFGNAKTVGIETDGGTLTITADTVDIATDRTGDALDVGAGEVVFLRSTDGAVSLGDDNGGLHISQEELDVIAAGTLTVGASGGGGHTTVVNTKGADLGAFGTVDFNAPVGLSDPIPDDPDSGAEMPEGTDPDTLMPDIRRRESAGDRAGGAAFFSNELGAPFQADVFSETFDLIEFDDPDGLLRPPVDDAGGLLRRPTIGSGEPGNQGDLPTAPGDDAGRPGNVLQAPTDRTDAWDEEDEIGEVTDPHDLGELDASAGASDQQAGVETCVAAFLGEVLDAAAACQ